MARETFVIRNKPSSQNEMWGGAALETLKVFRNLFYFSRIFSKEYKDECQQRKKGWSRWIRIGRKELGNDIRQPGISGKQ